MNCSESVPFITGADIERETAGTYLGDYDIQRYQIACKIWPHADLPKSFLAPVRSDKPALLISGAEDPATPPALADRAAEQLSHPRVVTIPFGTHLTSSSCIDRIIVDFLASADGQGVDASCVKQIRNPPFYVPKQ